MLIFLPDFLFSVREQQHGDLPDSPQRIIHKPVTININIKGNPNSPVSGLLGSPNSVSRPGSPVSDGSPESLSPPGPPCPTPNTSPLLSEQNLDDSTTDVTKKVIVYSCLLPVYVPSELLLFILLSLL